MQGCLILIVILFIIGLFGMYPVPATILTVFLVLTLILISSSNKKTAEENELARRNESISVKKIYDEIKSEITIPDNALKVEYTGGFVKLLKSQNYMWIDNNLLCFFPSIAPDTLSKADRIIIYKIPISKIEYYATRGDIIHENKITGGGGGGSSLGGAVVGGAIAGGAGAVIGSRKKTDPIKSELVTHDERETFLNFFDDVNTRHSMFFKYNDYNTLYDLLPEKSYDIINAIRTKNILNKVCGNINIPEQIRELAKLKDEGILTEEEFSEKKKSLLAQMN